MSKYFRPWNKVICEIAFRLVQPDTRAAINRLMQLDSEFKTFSDSCIYPDHSAHTCGRAFPKSSAGFQRTYLGRVPKHHPRQGPLEGMQVFPPLQRLEGRDATAVALPGER